MMLAEHLKNNQKIKQKIQAATDTKEKAPISFFNIFLQINPVFGIPLEDVGDEVDR